jgi:hypothetical protein
MKQLAALAVLVAATAFADDKPPATTNARDDKPLITDEEEGPPKLSLPTEEDRVAWTKAGFRLHLGAAYGRMVGQRGAPSGRLIGAKLRVGLQLDAAWSVTTSFEYAQAKETRGLDGLRFLGTLDPTWHINRSFAVSIGFGFGGIVEGRNTGRPDAEPLATTLETSYTFPDSSPPIARCSGVGPAALARVEWGYVMGPRSRFTLSAEGTGQWTGCVHDTNRFEPDTGKAIVRRQFWSHAGFTLNAGIAWR